ncbi:MAG: hypothetical protein IJG84_16360 [Kiritimatiellae bacterium]|nr:hypothetical protein [Kiritimatiellia bacterium]
MNEKPSFPVYDLTATDEAEGVECYAYMLNEVLKREKVTNIAIAGRYGSGKSSFLNTFFKSRKSETDLSKEEKKLRNKEKVLKISMAAFLEKEGRQKMDESRERLLEISILQQMFYHVTQGELPFSRFRRLTRFGWGKWWRMLGYSLLLMVTVVFLVQPSSMLEHLPNKLVLKWSDVAYWVGVALLLIVGAIGVFQLLRFYKKIKHCNLNFQNIELDIEKEDETSVFNRYMDEVVYFFEETGYTIVLFEDIDRFKDTQIFAKLRELNLILNSAKQIEQKPIRFIYALRDNVFTGTERVKFFDFILPIVPVVDSKSSAAKLKKMLIAYVGEDKIAEYDEMIHALSPYISDMRLMNNIVNEFSAYREMISTQGHGLRFLGMVIFKNFFPAEFAKLYERTDSLLARILERKKEIVEEKISELIAEVENIKTVIAESEKEKIGDVRELQMLYMVCCVGKELPNGAESIEWKGHEGLTLSEFFSNPDLFDSLYGNDFRVWYSMKNPHYVNHWERRPSECKWTSIYPQIQKEMGEYKKRIKAIADKVVAKREEYNRRITELVIEKNAVCRLSLADMLKKGWFGEDDIRNALKDCYPKPEAKKGETPPEEIVIKKETILLLYQLFYGGYVGENYEHFISVFKTGDMTRDDNDFETAVLENVEHQFDYALDNPAAVADHLGVGMFSKPAIRNLSLIETMIRARDRYKDKIEAFASRFISNTADNQRFAIELISRASAIDDSATKVIGLYIEHWSTCLDDLFKGGNLTEDLKVKLAEATLRWIKSSKGVLPSEVGTFVSEAKHPCEMFKSAGYDPEAMAKLLNGANVLLENCVFESDDEKKYVEAVRRFGCYSYENGMLERLMVASGVDVSNFKQAPMTCIRNSGLSDVVKDVEENFGHFVETFYVGENAEKEDEPKVVIDVANARALEVKDREAFVRAQKRLIEDLSLVKDDDLSNRLLMANTVVPSWQNVVHAAERFTYDDDAQGFLEKNRESLMKQDWQSVGEHLQKWIDWLISTETIPADALRDALELFPASIKIQELTKVDIPAERIRVATTCGRIKFTAELYEQLKKAGKEGHMELAEAFPSEFIQACRTNSWEMLHKDLARIFTGDRFSDNQKCDMLKMYEGCVSKALVATAVATFLTKVNYRKFSTTVLEGVFPHIVQPELQVLILQRLDPDAAKVKAMIPKMKEPYNHVLDEKSRKGLSSTALNRSFKRFLVGKGLITDKKVE